MATTQNLNPRTLAIIRAALLGGILIFGVIAWFLASSSVEGLDEETLSVLRLAFFGMMAAEGAALFFLQQRWKQATTFQERGTWSIIGWALGEGLALFGGVLLLLGAGPLPFLGGLLLFAIAWLLFPISSDE